MAQPDTDTYYWLKEFLVIFFADLAAAVALYVLFEGRMARAKKKRLKNFMPEELKRIVKDVKIELGQSHLRYTISRFSDGRPARLIELDRLLGTKENWEFDGGQELYQLGSAFLTSASRWNDNLERKNAGSNLQDLLDKAFSDANKIVMN